MPSQQDVYGEILDKISDALKQDMPASFVKDLAEAFAWVRYPNQPHGGGDVKAS